MEKRRAFQVRFVACVLWGCIALVAGKHGGLAGISVVFFLSCLALIIRRIDKAWNLLAVASALTFFGILPFLFLMGGGV